jgi:hypothetical protein
MPANSICAVLLRNCGLRVHRGLWMRNEFFSAILTGVALIFVIADAAIDAQTVEWE